MSHSGLHRQELGLAIGGDVRVDLTNADLSGSRDKNGNLYAQIRLLGVERFVNPEYSDFRFNTVTTRSMSKMWASRVPMLDSTVMTI